MFKFKEFQTKKIDDSTQSYIYGYPENNNAIYLGGWVDAVSYVAILAKAVNIKARLLMEGKKNVTLDKKSFYVN